MADEKDDEEHRHLQQSNENELSASNPESAALDQPVELAKLRRTC